MSETLITCENVGKKFCRDFKKSLWYGVKDSSAQFFNRRSSSRDSGNSSLVANSLELRSGEFWANKDITFELRRGECLGLIGRNGAGKTTLLKLLNGLIKPNCGRITMHGRIGALIALGAGFNPVLTGRENIFVNGSILGMSQSQILDRLDEIVEFAELHEFIDSPVRNYSSGMNVRLGFAAASLLVEPDILILDEVLAVGDSAFRHRCYSKVSQLMKHSAVILVSHSMEHIAQCATTVGLMQKGEMTSYNDTNEGIESYNKVNASQSTHDIRPSVKSLLDPVTKADVELASRKLDFGDQLTVTFNIESSEPIADVELFFSAIDLNQRPTMTWSSVRSGLEMNLIAGRQRISVTIDPLLLHDGEYQWNFMLGRKNTLDRFVWISGGGDFSVNSPYRPLSNTPYLPVSSHCEVEVVL